jgi:hypothetical protein
MAGHRAAVILVLSLIGLVVLGITLSGALDAVRTAQLALNLIVPAAVMVLFWRKARARIDDREAEVATVLGLEGVANRATGRLLAGIAHELIPHPERCDLRAEALVVAMDYQDMGVDLKVVVPEAEVRTDPNLLRHILHIFVGNAIRHGGERVAIWAAVEDDTVRLSVSDDGPGLPDDAGDHVFERYVDLAAVAETRPAGTGLVVASAIGELIGGQLSYRRDPTWTHFSLSLPLGSRTMTPQPGRVPLRAGIG